MLDLLKLYVVCRAMRQAGALGVMADVQTVAPAQMQVKNGVEELRLQLVTLDRHGLDHLLLIVSL